MSAKNSYAWIVVGTTIANQNLAMGILLAGFALFVVPWVNEFEVERSRVLLGSTLILVVNSLLSPLGGKLMDRVSLRTLILAGVACLAIGLVLVAFATSFWMILVAYATLLPLALMMCGSLSSQTLVTKWFQDGRGFALGVSSLGSSIGGFLLPAVISMLISSYSWRTTLVGLAVICLVLLIPLKSFVLRKSPPTSGKSDNQHGDAGGPEWRVLELLKMPMFWIPVLGFIPIMAGYTGVQFNLGAYVEDLGHDQGLAAKLIITIAVGQVIGKIAAGSLSELVDHRVIYWGMAILMGLALILITGGPSVPTLYIASLLLGAASGAVLPLIPIIYASRFGTRAIGTVLGIVSLILVVGSFGSYFSGLVYDNTNSYDMAFRAFAILLIPVSSGIYFLPSPEKAHGDWPKEDDSRTFANS